MENVLNLAALCEARRGGRSEIGNYEDILCAHRHGQCGYYYSAFDILFVANNSWEIIFG